MILCVAKHNLAVAEVPGSQESQEFLHPVDEIGVIEHAVILLCLFAAFKDVDGLDEQLCALSHAAIALHHSSVDVDDGRNEAEAPALVSWPCGACVCWIVKRVFVAGIVLVYVALACVNCTA